MSCTERVVIRVDASVEMGMGHLIRCLSLADALKDDGTEVHFLVRSHAAALTGLIEANGHAARLLTDPPVRSAGVRESGHASWLPTTWQQDAEQTLEAIGAIGAVEWLIVDHYALDAGWERLLRQRVPRLLAIDDIADRPHECDILLDQNFVLDLETRYCGRVPAACRTLLGPRYALLRPEFAKLRSSLVARSGEVQRILVCYGGSDPSNETARTLEAIKGLSHGLPALDVVIGLSNPHALSVSKLCRELPRAELHRGTDNMAELMRRADLAIGAGGVMCWERCCLGLPTIAVDIAPNQIGALTGLASIGAIVHLGSAAAVTREELAAAVKSLLVDSARNRRMGEAALALVDGQGSQRVRAEMELLTVPRAEPSR